VFNVQVNDEVIFSKKQQGRHAEPGEIKRLLDDKVAAYKATQGITWDHPPKD
jgi:predicted Rdx family selenoprotein